MKNWSLSLSLSLDFFYGCVSMYVHEMPEDLLNRQAKFEISLLPLARFDWRANYNIRSSEFMITILMK